jgi:translation initiation factor IF-3
MAFIKANFLSMRDEKGNDIGTMPTGQAKDYARKKGMELVAVDETVDPPVYKIQPRQRFSHQQPNDDKAQYTVTAATVRLTDENGKSVGVIPTAEARKMAEERGLDLIAVNNRIDPPIGKLGDLSKHIYDQKKAAKERDKKNRAAAKASEEKMLKLTSDTTDSSKADRARILKQANDFLSEGHPVKIVIKFRGREISHADSAMDRLRPEILDAIVTNGSGTVTKELKSTGGDMFTIQCMPAKKK